MTTSPRRECASSDIGRLHIACIGPRGIPAAYGGIERACEHLYSRLAERGHDVTMYCRSEYVADGRRQVCGVRLRSLPALRTRGFDTITHAGASLAHATATGGFDLIHLHALAPNLFSPLCRLRRVPVVATVHGLDWQRAKWRGTGSAVLRLAERSLVANAAAIIVVSRALQNYFHDTYARQAHYIPNGLDHGSDGATDAAALGRYQLTPGRYVLFVGRLVPEKRVDDVIAAFRQLPGASQLVIAADDIRSDAHTQSLHALAATDARVLFIGFQSQAAVRTLLCHAAACVNASDVEGLPMSVLESIAEGTPTIVSDIAAHRELLGGGADGLLFPVGNVGALTAAITRVLANPDRYRDTMLPIRERARVVFSWANIVEQTEQVYWQVVANYAKHRPHMPAVMGDAV